MDEAWIGFDLDGTLAVYDGWRGIAHIGAPVPAMVKRLKQHLAEGYAVKIFTARVCPQRCEADRVLARGHIHDWCLEHIGRILEVTHEKDFSMIMLYDDRCRQVEANTGRVIGEED